MRSFVFLMAGLVVAACTKEQPPPAAPPPAPAPKPKPVELTLFITGAENGWLLPTPNESGALVGGAAQMLGLWVKDGHCVGPLGDGGAPACDDGSTLALSTGDNSYGAAISSAFHGASTAATMKLMGYAASAFGNHEVDFGRPQFARHQAASGITYLAANLKSDEKEESAAPITVKPFDVFTRRGVKIAVVGLTTQKLPSSTVPGRLDGFTVAPDEQALVATMPDVAKQSPNAIVLVSDGCLEDLARVLEAHPDWKVSVAAGRQCGGTVPETAGGARLVFPGAQFQQYARVGLSFEGAVLKNVTSTVVPVTGADAAEPTAEALIADWKKRLDLMLGEQIGFSAKGFELSSPLLGTWLATALKEQHRADVGLINHKSMRHALPAGPLTMASVYDVIPFENRVVVVSVTGEALTKALENPEARFVGVQLKAIKPKKVYKVATHNFIYYGGDGFTLRKDEVKVELTGTPWQMSVIHWTKEAGSSEKKPLESKLK